MLPPYLWPHITLCMPSLICYSNRNWWTGQFGKNPFRFMCCHANTFWNNFCQLFFTWRSHHHKCDLVSASTRVRFMQHLATQFSSFSLFFSLFPSFLGGMVEELSRSLEQNYKFRKCRNSVSKIKKNPIFCALPAIFLSILVLMPLFKEKFTLPSPLPHLTPKDSTREWERKWKLMVIWNQ